MLVASIRQQQLQQRMFTSWINSRLRTSATSTATTTDGSNHPGTTTAVSAAEAAKGKVMNEKEKVELVYRLYRENHIPLAQSELRPWGAPYTDTTPLADLNLDRSKTPNDLVDKLADSIMKTLRILVHAFFRDRYVHHAVVLETVAAVPGMVAGMFRHFRSLRGMKRDHGKIGLLLEEAENERMHLLTWIQVCQPTLLERMLVMAAQFGFTSFYALCYLISPRFSHRLVGYLEEEAYNSYTLFLESIDKGEIENVPAPEIALRYWNLPPDATLRDVVLVVRADEACHRDFNHEMADKLRHGMH